MAKKSSFTQEIVINRAAVEDVDALCQLHGASFWQGWDEETFMTFLQDRTLVCLAARPIGIPRKVIGFVLVRFVAGEAEIITLAVDSAWRRQGVGYGLLDALLRHLYQQRAEMLFLEVEEHNEAARQLYRRFSFEEVGRRQAYYQTAHGRRDALTLKRQLRYF